MAYRDFHFEKIYEAPDVNILAEGLMRGAENTAVAIGNLFRGLAEQQQAKRKAADQYKFDLGEGKFENDDQIFFQKGLNITQRGKQEILTSGRLSPQLEQDQTVAMMEKKQSDWQFKTMQQHEADIAAKAKEDKYYDPEVDRNKLRVAAYGEDNDVYYATRGDRLEEFGKAKFADPKSLMGKLYTFDYVGLFRQKEKERTTGSPTAESTVFDKTPFLNEQGAPGVTINHAKEYLNSRADGSVARWVESLVADDMDEDVRYMKQRSDQFKGMSDDEIKLYLKSNPQENLYNKKDFATRVIEKAQDQLMEAASISKKIDYTTKVDKTVTGGLYNNDAIGHSYTEHQDDNVQMQSGIGFRGEFGGVPIDQTPVNKMPGGSLLIGKGAKIGQPIPVAMKPEYVYDLRTGKNQKNTNSMDFNLSGYQVQLTRKDGTPYFTTPEKIKDIPASELQNLNPDVKVFLRGYTIEQGNKLGEISRRKSELDAELAAATGDEEKESVVLDKIRKINDLRSRMNLSKDEFSDDDLLSAFRQNGLNINTIKRDVLVQPSEADLNIINRVITQGLDLKDRGKWSEDMRSTEQAFRQHYSSGGKQEVPKPPVNIKQRAGAVEPPLVSSDEDYRKLKKGDQYRAPDGRVLTKTRD